MEKRKLEENRCEGNLSVTFHCCTIMETDKQSSTNLIFLDIDGVMRPFTGLSDHWRQIFWRNYWTKIGRFDLVLETISEEKKQVLNSLIQSI